MKLYIENLGCAKNQVDAEVLAYNLKDDYVLVENAQDADLIIVNTCGFIQSAKEESINTFFALKEQCPKAKFILSGCLAQRYAQDLYENMPEADLIFGNKDLAKIKEAVKTLNKRQVLTPDFPDPYKESDTRDRLFSFPGSAYLKISEGCNHCCSYCAIPLIRGPLRSRPMELVLSEAKRLISSGIVELNVIAQDLAAYGYDWDQKSHFVELLDKLEELEGNFKIRMLYLHPDWVTDEIIDKVKNSTKILHYFDIPFQHAAKDIVKSMGRTGDPSVYNKLVKKIKEQIPDAVIRTTIMLGYPGDSKENFEIVKNFVKDCKFTWMGSFTYSLEEDTKAYQLTTEEEHNKLEKQAKKWQKELEKVQEKITLEALNSFVGKEYDVLIEENVEGEDLAIGRIYAQAPEVDGLTVVMGQNMEVGKVYRCGITKVNTPDLEAVKID